MLWPYQILQTWQLIKSKTNDQSKEHSHIEMASKQRENKKIEPYGTCNETQTEQE